MSDGGAQAAPMRNLLTDVAGLSVGNSGDTALKSGVTVVFCDEAAVASAHLMGGAPGSREIDLLAPEQSAERIDAVLLSGGSAFGLDAAAGVMAGLRAMGRGTRVGPVRVPIVPGAILFDLLNGGDKNWTESPYPALGRAALDAAGKTFEVGTAGAGIGATTANLKGGLGSASAKTASGFTVAALMAVNALGQATVGDTAHFWAAPFEVGGEFGGRGPASPLPEGATMLRHKAQARAAESTTIGVVATDAVLTKAQAKRLAVMAHDGFARALWPSHTPIDGDLIFALSTGRMPGAVDALAMIEIGAVASACVARAIARGVYAATPAAGDLLPTWREQFGG